MLSGLGFPSTKSKPAKSAAATPIHSSGLSSARVAGIESRTQILLDKLKANERLQALAEKSRFNEPLSSVCYRFATTNTNAGKCWKLLVNHLEYREKHNTNALAVMPALQVFNSNPEAQAAYSANVPHGYLGKDRDGNPVLYKHVGHIDWRDMARRGCDFNTCCLYNEWQTERLGHQIGHQGRWSCILDVRPWTSHPGPSCFPHARPSPSPPPGICDPPDTGQECGHVSADEFFMDALCEDDGDP